MFLGLSFFAVFFDGPRRVVPPPLLQVASIALDHTGLTLLVSYRDSCNRLWDLRTQRCLPQRLKVWCFVTNGWRSAIPLTPSRCFPNKFDSK